MIGQQILFKWPTYGWSLGKVSEWNSNPKCTVCKQIVKSIVIYPEDSSSGPHCLPLDNYNTDSAGDADNGSLNHTWLMPEPFQPQQSGHGQP
mmetsp:Transcript_36156/g.58280  ORF Transcript_36156/g.58280 Transcript_36156/m.58280 type:complete len:92 (+) Transcript_36156:1520-1795(+)